MIQLTLGDYGPRRAHLRRFRTGNTLGDGCWTMGGASVRSIPPEIDNLRPPGLVSIATAVVEMAQMVPRPYCAEGPGDFLSIAGPVHFQLTAEVTADLRFNSQAEYSGLIMAQPDDFSRGTPVPVGDPFPVRVSGLQHGSLGPHRGSILAIDRKYTKESDGAQVLVERRNIPQFGLKTYESQTRCIDDGAALRPHMEAAPSRHARAPGSARSFNEQQRQRQISVGFTAPTRTEGPGVVAIVSF